MSLSEKQSFIEQQIRERGLEREALESYLKEKRAEGDSLENWSLEELEEVR